MGEDTYFIFNLIENTGENMEIYGRISNEEKLKRFNAIENIISCKHEDVELEDSNLALNVMPELRTISSAFSGLMLSFSNSQYEVNDVMVNVMCGEIKTENQVKELISSILYKALNELNWVIPILERKEEINRNTN